MKISTLAIIAAALLPAAAGAETRYYSRQPLPNLAQQYSYAATYGAYGTCSGGTQTASISKCTRSDGQVVANSSCSPPTKSQSCVSYTYRWVQTDSGSTCAAYNEYDSNGNLTHPKYTQTYANYSCQRSDGATVSGSYCPQPNPSYNNKGARCG